MEPDREVQRKALEPSAEPKPKRFRLIRLEERIAPQKGGGGKGTHACVPVPYSQDCTVMDNDCFW